MANRKDLINAIAEDCGTTKVAAKAMLESIIKNIKGHLSDKSGDQLVRLVNFGTFKVVERKARKGRNPQTGKPLQIPAKNVIKFTVGKALKEGVNNAPDSILDKPAKATATESTETAEDAE